MIARIKAVTNRAPEFLKTTYPHSGVDLIDHDGFVKYNEKFITWSPGKWKTWRMGKERTPVLCGIYDNLNSAVFRARK
jgi:hypothetical protein